MSEAIVKRAEELYGDSYGERFRKYEDTIAELKEQVAFAKSIVQSLLDNSDEYAVERAREFLKETE